MSCSGPHRIIALLAIFFCLTAPLQAGATRSTPAEIEAAFLVQFSKYICWPDRSFKSPEAPIIIGILGKDPFGSKINRISRAFKTHNRGIEILRLRKAVEARKCHILYISEDQSVNLEKITDTLAGYPILLVSRMDDFLARGGMINFVIIKTKMRFNINFSNSRKSNLKISSKLLKIAHQVKQ